MYEFIFIFLAPYICSTMYLENTASVVFNYWISNLNNYKIFDFDLSFLLQ
jgi:hypothetical protein